MAWNDRCRCGARTGDPCRRRQPDGRTRPPLAFDPATATGTLRIAAFDSQLAVLVPELVSLLDREAPGLKLVTRALARQDAIDALDAGTIDLAAGFFWDLPEGVISHPLHEEGYLTIARLGHPVLDGDLDIARFTGFPHLIVSPAAI